MGLKSICERETNHLASCRLAHGDCHFLYLQLKKNKVTQNRSHQVFKRLNFGSMVLLATHFSLYELSLVFRNPQTSTFENRAF